MMTWSVAECLCNS